MLGVLRHPQGGSRMEKKKLTQAQADAVRQYAFDENEVRYCADRVKRAKDTLDTAIKQRDESSVLVREQFVTQKYLDKLVVVMVPEGAVVVRCDGNPLLADLATL